MRLAALFRKKPFSILKSDADRLFDKGEYGQAKLAYERAADAKDVPEDAREPIGERIGACCDAIARKRVVEAERLFEGGDDALGEEELRHALETAWDAALRKSIAERLDQAQRQDVRKQVAHFDALDDEGRYLAIAGSWEDAQALEYDSYGERFRHALLQFHDGHIEVATREFDALIADVHDALYLWFEVGRIRLEHGDRLGAREAFTTFLTRLSPDEGGDSRLTAHMALAALAVEQDDFEAAMDQYSQAVEAMPADPRPYLAMGAFMRRQGLEEEAIDVLLSGLSVIPDEQPNFRLWQELGLAYADAGQDAKGIEWLEQVVSFFTERKHFDLPPEGTLRLSQLYERGGNLARAADLLRLLCEGSDRINLFVYHLEAARVLSAIDATADAERMLARATELLPDDDDARAALTACQTACQTSLANKG